MSPEPVDPTPSTPSTPLTQSTPSKPLTPLTPLAPLSETSGLCGGPGQMSCAEANEMIQVYLDHTADADAGALLTEHLGECPPCESEFAVYQRILDALGRCRPDLPSETAQRLQQFCTSLCDGTEPAAERTPQDRLDSES